MYKNKDQGIDEECLDEWASRKLEQQRGGGLLFRPKHMQMTENGSKTQNTKNYIVVGWLESAVLWVHIHP